MADTVKTTWLYPPNWDGEYFGGPGGGDPVPGDNPPYGWKRMRVQFTNLSDGTGESAVRKLVRSEMYGVQGLACDRIGIEKIHYTVYGMSVQIDFDMSPNQLIAILPENQEGTIIGPFYPDTGLTSAGLPDRTYDVDETGDVLFTTIGHSANDSYTITMDIVVKE